MFRNIQKYIDNNILTILAFNLNFNFIMCYLHLKILINYSSSSIVSVFSIYIFPNFSNSSVTDSANLPKSVNL